MRREKRVFARSGAAFTLVEVLVVFGVLLLLAGLVLPALSQTRHASFATVSLSNIRQVGVAIVAYGQDYLDRPPILFPPVLVMAPPPWLIVEVDGESVQGAWFTNGSNYPRLLNPRLPPRALRDPHVRSPTGVQTDYSISNTFYATPEYWNRATQTGPEQWIVQQLQMSRSPRKRA